MINAMKAALAALKNSDYMDAEKYLESAIAATPPSAPDTAAIPKAKLPERIFLQVNKDEDSEWYDEIVWREVSWCEDRINSDDMVFIREDLATPQPCHTIPEGWQLVPKEYTYAMHQAFIGGNSFEERYKAMLSAAPEATK